MYHDFSTASIYSHIVYPIMCSCFTYQIYLIYKAQQQTLDFTIRKIFKVFCPLICRSHSTVCERFQSRCETSIKIRHKNKIKPQPPSHKRKMRPTLLLLSVIAIALISGTEGLTGCVHAFALRRSRRYVWRKWKTKKPVFSVGAGYEKDGKLPKSSGRRTRWTKTGIH